MAARVEILEHRAKNRHFYGWGGQFPSKFDILIPSTPHYEGMVV